MAGKPGKYQFHSRLAGNCFDDAKWEFSVLQHGPLLNVELKITKHSILKRGGGNFAGVQSIGENCFLDRKILGIAQALQLIIQPSDKRPASYEGNSKTDTFFFRKADDFDGERAPASFERFEERDCQHDAENSVVCAGVWNGVEVRTDQQSAIRAIRAGIQPVEISRGVNSHGHSQGTHPVFY